MVARELSDGEHIKPDKGSYNGIGRLIFTVQASLEQNCYAAVLRIREYMGWLALLGLHLILTGFGRIHLQRRPL